MSNPAPLVREIAHAKLNLSLTVLGRRPDGYHEIDSLVGFAAIGDIITVDINVDLASSANKRLTVTGPFGTAISGANLVETAVACVEAAAGQTLPVHITLEKNLPVAAGIGGGSADAAAALRALARAFPTETASLDWHSIATGLGADVPVCLASTPAWMNGIGDKLTPVTLPRLDIVLANPMTSVPVDKTRRVFQTLAAPLLPRPLPRPLLALPKSSTPTPHLADLDATIALMRSRGNDLEPAALRIVPEIADVQAALAECLGCRIAMLSGAGPTVFGIFDDAHSAAAAAAELRAGHRSWWIAASTVGGGQAA